MNWIDFGFGVAGNVVDSAIDFGMQHYFHDVQQKDIINAENRANAEWDRRFAKENLYNTPSMQAKRLKDAGVNPLGVLSGNAPTPSASGSTNQPQAPDKMSMPERISLAELNLQSQRIANESKVATAQANKDQAQADYYASQKEGQDWENKNKQAKWEEEKKNYESERALNSALKGESEARKGESEARKGMYKEMEGYYIASTNYIKKYKPWMEGIQSGSMLISSVGNLLSGILGWKKLLKPQNIDDSKPLDQPLEGEIQPIGPIDEGSRPYNPNQLPGYGKDLVENVDTYTTYGNMGRYDMDDGSTFEFGVGEDGMPWWRAFDSKGKEDSKAQHLKEIFEEFILPMFSFKF